MIIRCPECSTGFRLSDDRVRGEPIKVRCSNCEHIFKAGLIDGKPTLFDASEERLPDDKQLAERDDETAEVQPENDERNAAPADPAEEGTDEEMALEETVPPEEVDAPTEDESDNDSDYDPFPHAGSEAQAETSGAISSAASAESSDSAEETDDPSKTDGEYQSGEAIRDTADMQEQPGSVSDDAESEQSVSVHAEQRGGAAEFEGEETAVIEPEQRTETEDEQISTNAGVDSGTAASGIAATDDAPTTGSPGDQERTVETSLADADIPQDDDSIRTHDKHGSPKRESSAKSGEDAASPSESTQTDGGEGADSAGPGPAGSSDGHSPADARPPGGASEPDAAETENSSPAASSGPPPETQNTSGSTTGATGRSSSPAETDFETAEPGLAESSSPPGAGGDLAVDGVGRVESASLGSRWLQTFANVMAVVLLLAGVFVGLAAAQNGGLFDFGELGQMVQVAFTDAEYDPPDRLIKEVPKPVEPPEPKHPIEFKNVFVQRVPLEEGSGNGDSNLEALVLKGEAENIGDSEQVGVKVRGIVYESERVEVQETAPLGVDLTPADITSADSTDALISKISSDEPAHLPSGESRPFTVVFESVPKAVEKGADVSYRVEVAKTYDGNDSG